MKQDLATLTVTDEIGQRNVERFSQFVNATGEVVGNAFNWVVEHPVETVGITVLAVGAFIAYTTGIGEAVSAIAALFGGLLAIPGK